MLTRRSATFSFACLLGLGCGAGGSSASGDASAEAHAQDATIHDGGGGDGALHDAADAASPDASDAPVGDGGSCLAAGAGKSTYTCPSGGLPVGPTDDLATAVASAGEGATLCIQGHHYVTAPLVPKKNQTWIGVDSMAAIDGSTPLSSWTLTDSGTAWVTHVPSLVMHQDGVMSSGSSGLVYACYEVSTYEDDVFYGGQRMMRVLSTSQLTGTALPPGQAITTAETGRFFVDYGKSDIYITLDPSKATVELATVATIIDGSLNHEPDGAVAGGTVVESVSLSNLLVEKALVNGIGAGPSWTLTDVTVQFAHEVGVTVGGGTEAAPTTLERVLMTSNGRYGLSGGGSWLTVKNSELSWNNIANHARVTPAASGACDFMSGTPGGYWGAGGAKIVLAAGGSTTNPDLQILGMQSHDNVGPGFWTDVNNRYVLVQGGRFYDNEWFGYFHEIGCDIDITGVEADHNGTPIKNTGMQGYGIVISDSNNATIHGNTVHDNASGTIGFIYQLDHSGISGMTCVDAGGNDDNTAVTLKNDTVADNDIYTCDAGATTGMLYGATEDIVSRGDKFTGNTYHVPSSTGTWWSDPSPKTWAAWQAIGLDTTGTEAAPCAYSAPPPTCP
jgi:hypothetical protein